MRNKPTKETIIRTLVLFFALANQTLVLFGHTALPITDDKLYELISWLFTAGSSLVCWWKNQSFSDAAIEADIFLQTISYASRSWRDGGCSPSLNTTKGVIMFEPSGNSP